jgi:uncharacterized protein (TIGR02996 family)
LYGNFMRRCSQPRWTSGPFFCLLNEPTIPMTHDDAFLQAVIENPDDDAPRLIYADWLEEHRRMELAEFIRIQCDLAAGRVEEGAKHEEAARRAKGFLARCAGQEWQAPLREEADGSGFRPCFADTLGFHRGFAENVLVRDSFSESIVTRLQRLLRRAPVRYLEVSGGFSEEEDFSILAPDMTRLKGFMLTNVFNIDETGLERLLTSPHLAGLESLVVDFNHNGTTIDPDVFRAVVASPHWKRLTELSLHRVYAGLDDAAMLALARSASMAGLTHLDLADSEMQPATAKALAQSPYLNQLIELNLAGCVVGAEDDAQRVEGWLPLMESPNLSQLRRLGVGVTLVRDEPILAAWQSRFPPTVLEIQEYGYAPWVFHRWNRYFPQGAQSVFIVADCASTEPRRFQAF